MGKLGHRLLLLGVIFAGGLLFFFLWNGRGDTSDTVYTVMKPASLPTVAFTQSGTEINVLHGYTQEMDVTAMQDVVTPVGGERILNLVVHPYEATVKGLSCELRSMEDLRLIERKQIAGNGDVSGDTELAVRFGDLLAEGGEYILILTMEVSGKEPVYYYTRLYYRSDGTVADTVLEFTKNLHNNTFDENKVSAVSAYLEPDSSKSYGTLGHVTIHSTAAQVTWGDLAPVRLGEPQITFEHLGETQGAVSFDYEIETGSGTENVDTYKVHEFFCVRLVNGATYLMSYDRTMTEAFDISDAVGSKHIELGVLPSADVTAKSEGSFTVFAADGELWEYDARGNEAVRIFSFRQSGDDGIRTRWDSFDYRIISVDELGNVDFLVLGYMNRGEAEGKCGLFFYEYNKTENNLSEVLFIPSDKPYDILKEEIGSFFYVGVGGQIYLISGDALYSVDLIGKEPTKIVSGLTEGSYVISEDQSMIAWEENSTDIGGTTICIMYLKEGNTLRVSGAEGEYCQPYGFLDSDFIFGLYRESERRMTGTFETECPAYALEIMGADGAIKERYEASGLYISDVSVANGRVMLTRKSRAADGSYADAAGDSIIPLGERPSAGQSMVSWYADSLRSTVYRISYAGTKGSTRQSTAVPKQVSTGDRSEILLGEDTSSMSDWYAYSAGRLVYAGSDLAYAVASAFDEAGYVMNAAGRTVWERGTMPDSALIVLDSVMEAAASQEDSLRACLVTAMRKRGLSEAAIGSLNGPTTTEQVLSEAGASLILPVSGCTIRQLLYFVAEGCPIIALAENSRAYILCGFDVYNVVLYDPTTVSTFKMGREEAEQYFSTYGSRYFGCR